MEYRYRPSSHTFALERKNLAQALATIKKRIQALLDNKGTPVSGYNDITVYQAVARGQQIWYEEWDRHGHNPYYGRIEYVDRTEGEEPTVVYVSKAQRSLEFEDANGRLVDIIPWNAPVARMFITHRSVPGQWDLDRVTRIGIDNLEVVEVADTFRGPMLPPLPDSEGENAAEQLFEKRGGGKLSDIVATLQEEQYDLIVQPLRQNLVIQGGPGSGKTEIALHRIVHLLHSAALSPQQILYLGPSGPFLRYVSDILPSLDAQDVVLHDLVSWLSRELGVPVRKKSASSDDALLYDEVFTQRLERWVDHYAANLAKNLGDLRMAFDVETVSGRHQGTLELSSAQVYETFATSSRYSLRERWRLLRHRWDQMVETALAGAESRQLTSYQKLARQRFDHWQEQVPRVETLQDLMAIYPVARQEAGIEAPFHRESVWALADALALLFLAGRFLGHSQHYALVVLDEAQDVPAVGFALAEQLVSTNGSLTLVGDPFQHLNPYTEVENWSEVANRLHAQHVELLDNYRSGAQIVHLANAAHPAGIKQVPRRGGGIIHPPVKVSESKVAEAVMQEVVRGKREYLGQVAVIFANKAPRDLLERFQRLKPETIEMAFEPENPEPYDVIMATVEYAKGLEFDMVILMAETEEAFETTGAGAYQLFTGISRAREEVMMMGLRHLPKLYGRCYRQALRMTKFGSSALR
ncbi:hypothetical protein BXT84_07065 [Sulfobacillus thermotolerans]|uniref:UvrD-like helicase ATP-binding domain-containing protein n=1 Tax=Sulfobacillus thermotolerans TaxID=338644 RepID=A0ABM6RQL3_9FIRM|nr:hypothetical protein BXT84_07065 [Sulfobacillus thermotolerans]